MLKTAIETIPDVPLEEKVRYYHDVVFNRINQTKKTIDQLGADPQRPIGRTRRITICNFSGGDFSVNCVR